MNKKYPMEASILKNLFNPNGEISPRATLLLVLNDRESPPFLGWQILHTDVSGLAPVGPGSAATPRSRGRAQTHCQGHSDPCHC